MKRLILAALAALLMMAALATDAMAWPSITTYTFREGDTGATVSTGWTDTAVRFAGGTAPDKNYGGDDSLAIAPIAAAVYGEAIILLKCDFEASLPANFVCTRAFAGIYKHQKNTEPSAFSVIDQLVWVYRCMNDWDEGDGQGMNINTGNWGGNTSGVTANNRHAGGVDNWGVDSAQLWAPFRRTGTQATRDTSSVAAAGYWGTDSEFNGDTMTGGENIPSEPESEFYLRTRRTTPAGTTPDNYGLHIFEVTHFVNLVLSGAIENNGWVITNSTSNLTLPSFLASSENATVSYRPIMWIEGFVVGSGSGASNRVAFIN